jgi:hypothetical protein
MSDLSAQTFALITRSSDSCAVRTHAHENREPATTRWVRAAGADIARFAEARPLGCQHSACFRSGLPKAAASRYSEGP